MLLTHPDRKGRGHSPLDWALVGKTACSLERLRLAGFDLPGLTGDPYILEKLKGWIEYAGKNGNTVLDLEAEKKWDSCILATLEAFPGFRPYFDKAWERFKDQKANEANAIMAEIAKDARELESQHLKDRCARLEGEKAEIKEGAQIIHENAKAVTAENVALKKARSSPPLSSSPASAQAIQQEAKSEMRRQFEVLRELESFTVALSLSNTSKTPIPMKPNWEALCEKAPAGDFSPSLKFFEILDQLPDFTEEAAELRQQVKRWMPPPQAEPEHSFKATTKEPTRD